MQHALILTNYDRRIQDEISEHSWPIRPTEPQPDAIANRHYQQDWQTEKI
ncbi:MAG: hypothetical protein AAGH78_08575 [Cyanobacteria bacterium P01_H01_bin.58]